MSKVTDKRKAYNKVYYKKNKAENSDLIEKAVTRNRINRAKNRKYVNEFKLNNPCKCGESHVACLDLHHIDGTKENCIATGVSTGWGIERIKLELKKCIVVCANCHRKIHYSIFEKED